MNLKTSFIVALLLSLLSVASWEIYWRSQGYIADMDDDKYLWSKTRARVEKATPNDVVVVGSSRTLFNIQIYKWEELTGTKPIQLSNAGSTPLPTFHDIAQNTDFNGTVIVGVTPPLFFSTTFDQASLWTRSSNRIDFYENQTYAQKLNYALSIPLQNTFAFISNDEESWADDINLKSLLKRIKLEKRTAGPEMPPFYRFQDIDVERNLRMKEKMEIDTSFANSVKKVWKFFMTSDPNPPPPDKEGTMAYFLEDLEKFKARGGKAILVRSPSDGFFENLENQVFPREQYWDELVQKANIPAYHFKDYEQLKNFETIEWSHLSAKDADQFTENLVQILKKDGHIPNIKTN